MDHCESTEGWACFAYPNWAINFANEIPGDVHGPRTTISDDQFAQLKLRTKINVIEACLGVFVPEL
jgi:hypothetical protein